MKRDMVLYVFADVICPGEETLHLFTVESFLKGCVNQHNSESRALFSDVGNQSSAEGMSEFPTDCLKESIALWISV